MAALNSSPLQYQTTAPNNGTESDLALWEGLETLQRTSDGCPYGVAGTSGAPLTLGSCSQMFYHGVERRFGKLLYHSDHCKRKEGYYHCFIY